MQEIRPPSYPILHFTLASLEGSIPKVSKHNMAWIVQCAPEAAEILSHYGAEKHQRNSISVLVELLCTLDPPSFLCREFWYMPSTPTRLGRTNFSRAMDLSPWLCDVPFSSLHEDFGGSSSWSIHNQLSCIFNVASISLMVHPSTLFAEFTGRWSCAVTIQASTAVEIVSKWTASSVLPLEPLLQSFPSSVSVKPETSWLFHALLLEER